MNTFTDTFNRDDIRRVYASFAADYKIVAEWTELHLPALVEQTIAEIKAIAEKQFLKEVHLQLRSSSGVIREAAVYRVTTNASLWSADKPGDLYWDSEDGDALQLIVYFNDRWWGLTQAQRNAFAAIHMVGWGTSDFDGIYDGLIASTDRRFASRAYGMERTRYSS
jgi:Bacterial HORMA domain family 1